MKSITDIRREMDDARRELADARKVLSNSRSRDEEIKAAEKKESRCLRVLKDLKQELDLVSHFNEEALREHLRRAEGIQDRLMASAARFSEDPSVQAAYFAKREGARYKAQIKILNRILKG